MGKCEEKEHFLSFYNIIKAEYPKVLLENCLEGNLLIMYSSSSLFHRTQKIIILLVRKESGDVLPLPEISVFFFNSRKSADFFSLISKEKFRNNLIFLKTL